MTEIDLKKLDKKLIKYDWAISRYEFEYSFDLWGGGDCHNISATSLSALYKKIVKLLTDLK